MCCPCPSRLPKKAGQAFMRPQPEVGIKQMSYSARWQLYACVCEDPSCCSVIKVLCCSRACVCVCVVDFCIIVNF